MIVKELIAKMGLEFQQNDFARADNAISGLTRGIQLMAGVYATIRLGKVLGGFVKEASDVTETMNVIDNAFGASKAEVISWSERTAKEMGRSKYQLQQFAAGVGAMIEPMVGSKEAAAEMSTTLSALAVDLASYGNSTDEEAMAAMKSGIVGQTEPLRRYGIVLLDSTLAEFAHTRGITKKLDAMTNAEKVMLRYQYILENSKTAQGDAARTSAEYAGTVKRMGAAFKDARVSIGQILLPAFRSMASAAATLMVYFEQLATKTNVLQSGLIWLAVGVSGVAFAYGVSLVHSLGAALVAFVAMITTMDAAGIRAVILQVKVFAIGLAFLAMAAIIFGVFTEIYAMLNGGRSVFQDLNDWLGKLYDKFMDFEKDNPVTRFITSPLRMAVGFAVKLKEIVYALGMAMTGDFSGLRSLGQDLVEHYVNMGSSIAGGTMSLVNGAADVASRAVVAGSNLVLGAGGGFSMGPMTINQTVNAGPGQDPQAIANASARQIDEKIEERIRQARRDLTPSLAGAR